MNKKSFYFIEIISITIIILMIYFTILFALNPSFVSLLLFLFFIWLFIIVLSVIIDTLDYFHKKELLK